MSIRTIRAEVGSMRRNSDRSVLLTRIASAPAISTPRGTGAHQHERQQIAVTFRVFFRLCLLEGSQNLVSNRDRVGKAREPRSKPCEFVPAEVAVARPRREDQIVVFERDAFAVDRVDEDPPPIAVDTGDLAEDHRGVPLASQNAANRRGGLRRAQDRRRHLVQEGLEQVVVLPIDEDDAHTILGGPPRTSRAAIRQDCR